MCQSSNPVVMFEWSRVFHFEDQVSAFSDGSTRVHSLILINSGRMMHFCMFSCSQELHWLTWQGLELKQPINWLVYRQKKCQEYHHADKSIINVSVSPAWVQWFKLLFWNLLFWWNSTIHVYQGISMFKYPSFLGLYWGKKKKKSPCACTFRHVIGSVLCIVTLTLSNNLIFSSKTDDVKLILFSHTGWKIKCLKNEQ